jgi:hypothetical protein
MAFNPDKGVIGVYPSYGQDFWEINLADNTCSHVTLGGDTIPTADFGGNGTFGRLQYDTGYHTYVLVVTDIAKQAALICRQHGGCTPDVANNFASVSAGTGIPGGATNLIRAVSFDSASDYPKTATEAVGQGITIRPENGGPPYVYDADVTTDGTAADGDGYLRFTAATLHGGDYGWVRIPFNDSDLTHQVGEGQEFCYQFRFRINDAILDTLWQDRTIDPPAYPTPGWKLASASAGDWGTTFMQSCEAPELVFQNTQLFNVPQMYHSCHDKDSSSPPFNSRGYSDPDLGLTNFLIQPNGPCSNYGSHTQPPCKGFQRNKWQTYEMCAKVGTWYRNDSVYHKDSTVTAYAADENEAPQTLLSFTDYDLVNGALSGTTCGVDEPCYGNIILFPYHLNVNEFQSHATGYYDYDSLVIAKRFIPFPGTRVPNPPDQLAASIVSSSRIDLSWRDNSSDELAFKIDKCQGSDIACWRGAAAFVEVARVAANTTSYSATGLTTGTQYTFRVSAVNGYGDSPWAGGTCTWADNPCYATATTP